MKSKEENHTRDTLNKVSDKGNSSNLPVSLSPLKKRPLKGKDQLPSKNVITCKKIASNVRKIKGETKKLAEEALNKDTPHILRRYSLRGQNNNDQDAEIIKNFTATKPKSKQPTTNESKLKLKAVKEKSYNLRGQGSIFEPDYCERLSVDRPRKYGKTNGNLKTCEKDTGDEVIKNKEECGQNICESISDKSSFIGILNHDNNANVIVTNKCRQIPTHVEDVDRTSQRHSSRNTIPVDCSRSIMKGKEQNIMIFKNVKDNQNMIAETLVENQYKNIEIDDGLIKETVQIVMENLINVVIEQNFNHEHLATEGQPEKPVTSTVVTKRVRCENLKQFLNNNLSNGKTKNLIRTDDNNSSFYSKTKDFLSNTLEKSSLKSNMGLKEFRKLKHGSCKVDMKDFTKISVSKTLVADENVSIDFAASRITLLPEVSVEWKNKSKDCKMEKDLVSVNNLKRFLDEADSITRIGCEKMSLKSYLTNTANSLVPYSKKVSKNECTFPSSDRKNSANEIDPKTLLSLKTYTLDMKKLEKNTDKSLEMKNQKDIVENEIRKKVNKQPLDFNRKSSTYFPAKGNTSLFSSTKSQFNNSSGLTKTKTLVESNIDDSNAQKLKKSTQNSPNASSHSSNTLLHPELSVKPIHSSAKPHITSQNSFLRENSSPSAKHNNQNQYIDSYMKPKNTKSKIPNNVTQRSNIPDSNKNNNSTLLSTVKTSPIVSEKMKSINCTIYQPSYHDFAKYLNRRLPGPNNFIIKKPSPTKLTARKGTAKNKNDSFEAPADHLGFTNNPCTIDAVKTYSLEQVGNSKPCTMPKNGPANTEQVFSSKVYIDTHSSTVSKTKGHCKSLKDKIADILSQSSEKDSFNQTQNETSVVVLPGNKNTKKKRSDVAKLPGVKQSLKRKHGDKAKKNCAKKAKEMRLVQVNSNAIEESPTTTTVKRVFRKTKAQTQVMSNATFNHQQSCRLNFNQSTSMSSQQCRHQQCRQHNCLAKEVQHCAGTYQQCSSVTTTNAAFSCVHHDGRVVSCQHYVNACTQGQQHGDAQAPTIPHIEMALPQYLYDSPSRSMEQPLTADFMNFKVSPVKLPDPCPSSVGQHYCQGGIKEQQNNTSCGQQATNNELVLLPYLKTPQSTAHTQGDRQNLFRMNVNLSENQVQKQDSHSNGIPSYGSNNSYDSNNIYKPNNTSLYQTLGYDPNVVYSWDKTSNRGDVSGELLMHTSRRPAVLANDSYTYSYQNDHMYDPAKGSGRNKVIVVNDVVLPVSRFNYIKIEHNYLVPDFSSEELRIAPVNSLHQSSIIDGWKDQNSFGKTINGLRNEMSATSRQNYEVPCPTIKGIQHDVSVTKTESPNKSYIDPVCGHVLDGKIDTVEESVHCPPAVLCKLTNDVACKVEVSSDVTFGSLDQSFDEILVNSKDDDQDNVTEYVDHIMADKANDIEPLAVSYKMNDIITKEKSSKVSNKDSVAKTENIVLDEEHSEDPLESAHNLIDSIMLRPEKVQKDTISNMTATVSPSDVSHIVHDIVAAASYIERSPIGNSEIENTMSETHLETVDKAPDTEYTIGKPLEIYQSAVNRIKQEYDANTDKTFSNVCYPAMPTDLDTIQMGNLDFGVINIEEYLGFENNVQYGVSSSSPYTDVSSQMDRSLHANHLVRMQPDNHFLSDRSNQRHSNGQSESSYHKLRNSNLTANKLDQGQSDSSYHMLRNTNLASNNWNPIQSNGQSDMQCNSNLATNKWDPIQSNGQSDKQWNSNLATNNWDPIQSNGQSDMQWNSILATNNLDQIQSNAHCDSSYHMQWNSNLATNKWNPIQSNGQSDMQWNSNLATNNWDPIQSNGQSDMQWNSNLATNNLDQIQSNGQSDMQWNSNLATNNWDPIQSNGQSDIQWNYNLATNSLDQIQSNGQSDSSYHMVRNTNLTTNNLDQIHSTEQSNSSYHMVRNTNLTTNNLDQIHSTEQSNSSYHMVRNTNLTTNNLDQIHSTEQSNSSYHMQWNFNFMTNNLDQRSAVPPNTYAGYNGSVTPKHILDASLSVNKQAIGHPSPYVVHPNTPARIQPPLHAPPDQSSRCAPNSADVSRPHVPW